MIEIITIVFTFILNYNQWQKLWENLLFLQCCEKKTEICITVFDVFSTSNREGISMKFFKKFHKIFVSDCSTPFLS